jgi:hypothetical protein
MVRNVKYTFSEFLFNQFIFNESEEHFYKMHPLSEELTL